MTVFTDLLLSLFIAMTTGLFLTGLLQKVHAQLERRNGAVFMQPFIDMFKLVDKRLAVLSPRCDMLGLGLLLGSSLSLVLLIPVPGINDGALLQLGMNHDLLLLFFLLFVPFVGLTLILRHSSHPLGVLWTSQMLTALFVYSIPLVMIFVGLISYYGTTDVTKIVAVQQSGYWGIVTMPLFALSALTVMHAILGGPLFRSLLSPTTVNSAFDHSPYVQSPLAELAGTCLASFLLAQTIHLYLMAALFTLLFLGGGFSWWDFFMKMIAVLLIPVITSHLFPMLQFDGLFRWLLRWPTGFALLGLCWISYDLL